jgi:hypothetical protein
LMELHDRAYARVDPNRSVTILCINTVLKGDIFGILEVEILQARVNLPNAIFWFLLMCQSEQPQQMQWQHTNLGKTSYATRCW